MSRSVIALALFCALPGAQKPVPPAAMTQAFTAAYNLNYEDALRIARQDATARPDDPVAHRTLATIVWMQILFSRGGITIDAYLGSATSSDVKMPPPPPGPDAEFKEHVQKSIALAEAALKRNPQDVTAHYDVGAAY